MTENQAREAAYAAVVAAAILPAADIAFDNETFDTSGKTEWARVSFAHVGGGQHTLGEPPNRVFRRFGVLVMQFYVALDRGMQRMDALVRSTVTAFEQKVVSDVWFQDSEYREGAGGDDGFRRGVVSFPLTYDDVR